MKNVSNRWPETAGRVKIHGAYASDDGMVEGTGRSGQDFVRGYEESVRNHNVNMSQLVQMLRSNGVKALHSDDGWVDRDKNTVCFAYPNFQEKDIKRGDFIALGDYEKYRIVMVTGIEQHFTTRYNFIPLHNLIK